MQTSTTIPPTIHERGTGWLSRQLAWGLTPTTVFLAGIIALSAFLHFYRLENIGDGNLYYTAAVKSMLQSGHNFFFVAAEPGGSVTVDKPPLGLWIEAASAFIFGVNGLAVALPNILAGLLSVPLIYHLVQKYYGSGPGLVAALVVAITPVSVAAERNNTADGMLTFCLILAAWAFLRAVETDRRQFLWLGVVLVGVGFNIKMMQAFLPLPAFYALYFFGAQAGWGRKLLNLLLATVLLLAVSLWWPVVVDLIPTSQRPYIGSSTNNTVMELIVGHNGVSRWIGPQRGGGNRKGADGGLPAEDVPSPASGLPAVGRPGGLNEVGTPGILRFFQAPLSKELSWLLPFALFAGLLLPFRRRLTFPLHPDHRVLLLWGGWLITSLVFFSFASFFHAYYLVMLAPPLAVLAGSGAALLWQMRATHPRRAMGLLAGTTVLTLAFQWFNVYQFGVTGFWLPLAALLLLAGGGMLWWGQGPSGRWHPAAFALALTAILVTPLVWSLLTVTNDENVNLPAAYSGNLASVDSRRPNNLPNLNPTGQDSSGDRSPDTVLLNYLETHTQDVPYLLAVPSSMQGAPYVLATGRPVLYMGGFSGNDPVVSLAELREILADGDLRYVLLEDAPRGARPSGDLNSNLAEIDDWVRQNCRQVSELNTVARPGDGPPRRLYQCDIRRAGVGLMRMTVFIRGRVQNSPLSYHSSRGRLGAARLATPGRVGVFQFLGSK